MVLLSFDVTEEIPTLVKQGDIAHSVVGTYPSKEACVMNICEIPGILQITVANSHACDVSLLHTFVHTTPLWSHGGELGRLVLRASLMHDTTRGEVCFAGARVRLLSRIAL